MKKYLFTALLGVFGLFGFASADTVGNFTSDSDISSLTLSDSSTVSVESLLEINDNIFGSDFYICISTNDVPYYLYYDGDNNGNVSVSSSNYCFSTPYSIGDYEFAFYSDLEWTSKNLNGTFYFSSSPITYLSSSGGGDSNSTKHTFTCGGGSCEPDSFSPTTNFSYSSDLIDYTCSNSKCEIEFYADSNHVCDFEKNSNGFSLTSDVDKCIFNSSLTYDVYYDMSPFASFSITEPVLNSGGSDSSEGLLSGGTAVFGGIISSLGSAVSEFIPYVAYIGLGLLGAIIGFVAIKRLINRVRAKIFGTFNSRRRK